MPRALCAPDAPQVGSLSPLVVCSSGCTRFFAADLQPALCPAQLRLCSPTWCLNPEAFPAPWWQAACSLPLQGSGIDLACFRGSVGCNGSLCLPARLGESRLPTLTLRKPAGSLEKSAGGCQSALQGWWLPALGLRPRTNRALGTGPWTGLTHPEAWRALPTRAVRSAPTDFRVDTFLAAASSCKASWERPAGVRTPSPVVFSLPNNPLSNLSLSAHLSTQVPSGSLPTTSLCDTHQPPL